MSTYLLSYICTSIISLDISQIPIPVSVIPYLKTNPYLTIRLPTTSTAPHFYQFLETY